MSWWHFASVFAARRNGRIDTRLVVHCFGSFSRNDHVRSLIASERIPRGRWWEMVRLQQVDVEVFESRDVPVLLGRNAPPPVLEAIYAIHVRAVHLLPSTACQPTRSYSRYSIHHHGLHRRRSSAAVAGAPGRSASAIRRAVGAGPCRRAAAVPRGQVSHVGSPQRW